MAARTSATQLSTRARACAARGHTEIGSRGWTLIKVYPDNGISGAKGRDKRPAFDQLLKDAVRRQFDVIAAWSVDRLARSLQHLVAFLGEVHGAGVDLYLHRQAIDTTTPAAKRCSR